MIRFWTRYKSEVCQCLASTKAGECLTLRYLNTRPNFHFSAKVRDVWIKTSSFSKNINYDELVEGGTRKKIVNLKFKHDLREYLNTVRLGAIPRDCLNSKVSFHLLSPRLMMLIVNTIIISAS